MGFGFQHRRPLLQFATLSSSWLLQSATSSSPTIFSLELFSDFGFLIFEKNGSQFVFLVDSGFSFFSLFGDLVYRFEGKEEGWCMAAATMGKKGVGPRG